MSQGGEMNESRTLTFAKYSDRDGLPTCANKDGACKLLQSRRMGSVDVCGYLAQDVNRRGGDGSLEPHAECPIWKEKK